jgi:glucokinase
MIEVVAADIGGTHARFALAAVENGRVLRLDAPVTLRTADFAGLPTAWAAFAEKVGRPLPRLAGIAVAAPPGGEVLKFTNSPWIIRPALIAEKLGLDTFVLINDFGAVGHAVAQLGADYFRHICGPETDLPETGVTSIIGPGTGLGVAQLLRRHGHYHVIETEGGHIDFAPLDSIEDRILARLRELYRRVSIERLVSGPGLAAIYGALAAIEGQAVLARDDKTLWQAALAGDDALLNSALDRFCRIWGAVAGDLALAHGANSVVLAGGVGLRLAGLLPTSGFAARFAAKGRYEARMADLPVRLITHPEPGLYGAAAALAGEIA